MKAIAVFVFLGASLGWTQSAPPDSGEKPDTVIATFDDGGTITLAEYQALLQIFTQWQGQDRAVVLHKYGVIRKAAALAKSQKLDEKSPYKESLAFTIMYTMADFAVKEGANSIAVDPAEIEKYYNEHKEIYRQFKVSAIKVSFGGSAAPADSSSPPANSSRVPKKALTQEEAKAKAEKLVAQIRSGADFGKLVLLESDDETNKTKGGALGTWRMTDNVPDQMRATVLGLKEGEVSNPVQQGQGYYIFQADAVTYSPLEEVQDSIFAALKQQHTEEWMQNLDKSTTVEFPGKKDPVPPAAPSDPKK